MPGATGATEGYERGRPQSDLPTRFAAGVVMIAVAVAATLLGGWPFRILVAAAAAAMLIEWADMHRVARRWACAAAGAGRGDPARRGRISLPGGAAGR